MSGTNPPSALDRLEQVLDRQVPIPALESLAKAIRPPAPVANIRTAAVGLDANVFLRMSAKKSVEVIDYFASEHAAPLVLPGQTVQEFWNNQLAVIETVAKNITKHFTNMSDEVGKVDDTYAGFRGDMQALLTKFGEDFGYLYDEATMRGLSSLLEMLQARAKVPYVPRARFKEMAIYRKRTKTPPGFKDPKEDGDGDFYVWTDFLLGLVEARDEGSHFDRVVLVTNDAKADWSRGKIAHPVLAAEVMALTGASFEIWNLDQLGAAVKAEAGDAPRRADVEEEAAQPAQVQGPVVAADEIARQAVSRDGE